MMRKKAIRLFAVLGITVAGLTFAAFYSGDRNKMLAETTTSLTLNDDQLPRKTNLAFREGEVLTYRMHYGMINAGIAELEVKPDLIKVNGRQVYHIVGNGYTTGAVDLFFKVRDRYETYMDKDALLPLLFVRRVNEGGYKFSQDYTFNPYSGKVDIGSQKFDVPKGVQDMVSAFYAARNMDLTKAKPGDTFSLPCFLDKELWPLVIRYTGKEVISTDIGKFRCLKFQPIVQKGRVFKKDEDLTVWISDDLNRIPMRAKANVLVGSIKMDITSVKNLSNPTSRVD
jgi:hypothetical protein